MTKLLARARVVLRAAPTYLTAVAAATPFVSTQLATVLPDQAERIGSIGLCVAAWLTAAVLIIRRVAPVLPADRGVLPTDTNPKG